MDRQDQLDIVRAAYAKQILAAASVVDARLEAAFSAIRREDFLGPGPWPILRGLRNYVPTPDADPVYLYTNDLVGILPERRINNGQPSLHAHLIHRAAPVAGDRVVPYRHGYWLLHRYPRAPGRAVGPGYRYGVRG